MQITLPIPVLVAFGLLFIGFVVAVLRDSKKERAAALLLSGAAISLEFAIVTFREIHMEGPVARFFGLLFATVALVGWCWSILRKK